MNAIREPNVIRARAYAALQYVHEMCGSEILVRTLISGKRIAILVPRLLLALLPCFLWSGDSPASS